MDDSQYKHLMNNRDWVPFMDIAKQVSQQQSSMKNIAELSKTPRNNTQSTLKRPQRRSASVKLNLSNSNSLERHNTLGAMDESPKEQVTNPAMTQFYTPYLKSKVKVFESHEEIQENKQTSQQEESLSPLVKRNTDIPVKIKKTSTRKKEESTSKQKHRNSQKSLMPKTLNKELKFIETYNSSEYYNDLFTDFNPKRCHSTLHKRMRIYLQECLNVIKYFKSNRSSGGGPSMVQIKKQEVDLKRKRQDKGKPTLVFDMDETLLHCIDAEDGDCDPNFSLEILNSNTGISNTNYFMVRPQMLECMKILQQRYELIIYTASQPHYADAILNYLDPDNKIFYHRLYRQNCIELENNLFVKDLRIIRNRDMTNTMLIDNALYSYYFSMDQGLPILPFTTDTNDKELPKLTKFLMERSAKIDLKQYCTEHFAHADIAKRVKKLSDFKKVYTPKTAPSKKAKF